MTTVYLGLGSNIQPERYIELGLLKLEQAFQLQRVSPWYCSKAVGFDGPDFINLVVEIEYLGTLASLAQEIKRIEFDCGRAIDSVKFSSRTLDIDILLFGDAVGEFSGMQLPRADLYQYAYVLQPLLDISPDAKDPKSGQCLAEFLPLLQQQWIQPFVAKSTVS